MGGRWVFQPRKNADVCAFTGAAIDTRSIQSGQVFFAFVGEHVDGHDFLDAASKADASICVVSDSTKVHKDIHTPTLLVDDVLDAMTQLAQAWRAILTAKVIAITGSNGKTTTCRMVHAVCDQAGKASCSIKSFNNAIGVPMTILNTPEDAEYLIAEVGTSSPGEIEARTKLLKPDVVMIVSIGQAHLEELGGIEGVANEKASIVRAMPKGGVAIIPAMIEPLNKTLNRTKHTAIHRLDASSQISIEQESTNPSSTTFKFDGELFAAPMLGKHNASNAAMAVMVGRVLGFDDDVIRQGLAGTQSPAMRFERIEIDNVVMYNDAYNANPDSMQASLATFEQLDTDEHKIVVLGEMLELGDQSPLAHRALVESLGGFSTINQFVLVGSGFDGIELDGLTMTHVPCSDQDSLCAIADGIKPGSVVLLKGSRGVGLERIVYTLQRQASTHA